MIKNDSQLALSYLAFQFDRVLLMNSLVCSAHQNMKALPYMDDNVMCLTA